MANKRKSRNRRGRSDITPSDEVRDLLKPPARPFSIEIGLLHMRVNSIEQRDELFRKVDLAQECAKKSPGVAFVVFYDEKRQCFDVAPNPQLKEFERGYATIKGDVLSIFPQVRLR